MQRTVIHIQVGSSDAPATQNDLRSIAKLMAETPMPTMPNNTFAKAYQIEPGREIFHVRAGELGWIPTTEEMKALSELFATVSRTGGYAITRSGVTLGVLPAPEPLPSKPEPAFIYIAGDTK